MVSIFLFGDFFQRFCHFEKLFSSREFGQFCPCNICSVSVLALDLSQSVMISLLIFGGVVLVSRRYILISGIFLRQLIIIWQCSFNSVYNCFISTDESDRQRRRDSSCTTLQNSSFKFHKTVQSMFEPKYIIYLILLIFLLYGKSTLVKIILCDVTQLWVINVFFFPLEVGTRRAESVNTWGIWTYLSARDRKNDTEETFYRYHNIYQQTFLRDYVSIGVWYCYNWYSNIFYSLFIHVDLLCILI